MTKKANSQSTLKEAASVEKVWQENPDFTVGDLKLDTYVTFHAATRALDHDCGHELSN